jgi:hypothetical protein
MSAAAPRALIASSDPDKLDPAAVRFLGRACLERAFITLDETQLLVACLAQLEHRQGVARDLRRLRCGA